MDDGDRLISRVERKLRERDSSFQLTDPERKLLRTAVYGESCELAREGDQILNRKSPQDASTSWGPHRVVRARVLRWLLIDRRALHLVDPKGIRLNDAYIDDELNLQALDIPFQLILYRCSLPYGLSLQQTTLPFLDLTGCHAGSISADFAHFGGVFLRDGFVANDGVRLISATIDGNFECSGGKLWSHDGLSLSADGLTTGGDVFLDSRFTANGEVSLVGASIGGDLDCDGGHLASIKRPALHAARVTASGNLFLGNGFNADGEVRLVGASIGGDLDCYAGQFANEEGCALSADGITTSGNVFLNERFNADGEVRLVGASIGGQLSCRRAALSNPQGHALNMERITVSHILMDSGFVACGTVHIRGANLNELLVGNCATLNKESHNDNTLDALDLSDATIEGTLGLRGTSGENEDGKARHVDISGRLNLRRARIGDLDDESRGWPQYLALSDCSYNRIAIRSPLDARRRLDWLSRHDNDLYGEYGEDPDFRFDPQPYRQLATVLRRQGHELDADRIMVAAGNKMLWDTWFGRLVRRPLWAWNAYRKKHCRRRDLLIAPFYFFVSSLSWLGHTLLWALIGHGYRRWLPALWLLIFFLVGWYLFDLHSQIMQPADTVALNNQGQPWMTSVSTAGEDHKYPAYNPLVYTLDTLIPLVELHQNEYWIPEPGWLRGYLWFHTAVGWALSTLFLVGLTGVVRQASTGEASRGSG